MARNKDKTRFLLLKPSDALATLSTLTTSAATFTGNDLAGEIRTDSRQVQQGDIFIAYRGVASDGHAYLKTAAQRGAALLVVEDEKAAQGLAVPYVAVRNGREAWAWLAAQAAGHPQTKLTAIGVTGTNGKTSTTWITTHLLEALGIPTLMVGTTGAKLGSHSFPTRHTTPDPSDLYPLFAEAVELGAKVVAMEVSSHAISQKKLAPMTFACGVFTSFSRDHLDFHETMTEYWQAKCELFTDMLSPDAHAILCNQIQPPQAWPVLPGRQTFTYGLADKSPLLPQAQTVDVTIADASFAGCDVTVHVDKERKSGHVPYIGGHAVENFVAALMCARKITGAIADPKFWATLPDIPGRLERVQGENGPLVIVDYAHTPDALEKTLRILAPLTKGKLICLFGCGGDRDAGKRPEMGAIAERLANKVYVTSDNPRSEDPQLILDDIRQGFQHPEAAIFQPDRALAIAQAIAESTADDLLCIAGKGHETYQIIGNQTIDFDDRLIALESLRRNDA